MHHCLIDPANAHELNHVSIICICLYTCRCACLYTSPYRRLCTNVATCKCTRRSLVGHPCHVYTHPITDTHDHTRVCTHVYAHIRVYTWHTHVYTPCLYTPLDDPAAVHVINLACAVPNGRGEYLAIEMCIDTYVYGHAWRRAYRHSASA